MAYCVNGCWTVSNRIGVGTETPSLGFTAAGSAVGDAAIRLDNTSVGGRAWELYSTGTNFSQGNCNLIFYRSGVDGANAAAAFTWAGNFGVGTYSPAFKVHVCSTTTNDGIIVENTLRNISCFKSTGEHSFMYIDSAHQCIYQPAIFFLRASTLYSELRLQRASSSDPLGNYTESEGVIGTTSNTPFSIQSCGTRRVFLATSGNVGINTICPASLLHVAGGGTGTRGALRLSEAGLTNYWELGRDNSISGDFTISSNAAERMRITIAGNVGINTTSPASRLTVAGDVGIGSSIGSYTYSGPSQYGAITFPRAQLLFSNTNAQAQFYFVSNATLNASSQFTYTCNGRAGKINIDDGAISLDVASCAASGGVISWTSGITILNSGNVGINTSSPTTPLHVTAPSGDGSPLIRVCATAAPSTFNWAGSIMNDCLGSSRNFVLLIGQSQSTKNSGYIGYNHTGTCGSNSNFLTFGHYGNDNLMNLMADGRLGIGTTSPSYRLHVNGTFYAAGSSIDYKEGICQYDTNSCLFMCLKPVTYQYKDEWKHLGKELKSETQIGLIAEEVAEVMPELAILVNEEDEKVVRNVDYEKLSIILLSEVQKLRKEVDQLKQSC